MHRIELTPSIEKYLPPVSLHGMPITNHQRKGGEENPQKQRASSWTALTANARLPHTDWL